MQKTIVDKFVSANRDFFAKRRDSRKQGKRILVSVGFTDVFTMVSTLKISASVAEILKGQLLVLPHMKSDDQLLDIIRSFLPEKLLSTRRLLVSALLKNLFRIISTVNKIKTGSDLEKYKDADIVIGVHIYDSILRRQNLSSLSKLELKHKLHIALELTYYYAMRELLGKEQIDFAITPDNAYRDGLLYELMRSRNIPCIVGIDLNGISMHRNDSRDDYGFYCRVPDQSVIDRICKIPEAMHKAEKYAEIRFSGREKQHDTMRAFSNDKIDLDRKALQRDYNLAPGKKIVLVMTHIFCDAPHAYPGLLFQDFQDWLINTCQRLSRNTEIEFVIKEHPSASLYNEEGRVAEILGRIGLAHKVLDRNVNTRSLFTSIDVMVTCGGTAGMEFSCFGVPVLVGALATYYSMPYCVCPRTLEAYYRELSTLQSYKPLTDDVKLTAMAVLFTVQSLMKVKKDKIGLGTQDFYLGANMDINKFLQEMIDDCGHASGYNTLLSYMNRFVHAGTKNLYEYETLQAMGIEI